jgi:hypothetical protein
MIMRMPSYLCFEMDAGHMNQEAGYNVELIQLVQKAGNQQSMPQA